MGLREVVPPRIHELKPLVTIKYGFIHNHYRRGAQQCVSCKEFSPQIHEIEDGNKKHEINYFPGICNFPRYFLLRIGIKYW